MNIQLHTAHIAFVQNIGGLHLHDKGFLCILCKFCRFLCRVDNDFLGNRNPVGAQFFLAVMLRQSICLIALLLSYRKAQALIIRCIGNKISQMAEYLKCIDSRGKYRHTDIKQLFLVFRVPGIFCKRDHGNGFAVIPFFFYNLLNSLIHIVNSRVCDIQKQCVADQDHTDIGVIHYSPQRSCVSRGLLGDA